MNNKRFVVIFCGCVILVVGVSGIFNWISSDQSQQLKEEIKQFENVVEESLED